MFNKPFGKTNFHNPDQPTEPQEEKDTETDNVISDKEEITGDEAMKED